MGGMSQVKANRCPNYVEFAVENRETSPPTMIFQAQISAQRQANVVALRLL